MGESYFSPRNTRIFMLRGYDDFAFAGQHLLLGSMEYRFPLLALYRGFGTFPLAIKKLHALFFADYGKVFDSYRDDFHNFYLGLGGELKSDLLISYNTEISLRLGFAQGMEKEKGGSRFYFEFGSSF